MPSVDHGAARHRSENATVHAAAAARNLPDGPISAIFCPMSSIAFALAASRTGPAAGLALALGGLLLLRLART